KPIEKRDPHGNVVIYDNKIAEPTKAARVIVWADKEGNGVSTETQMVMMYPMSMRTASTPEPTTTTTMTTELTTTVVVTPVAETPSPQPPVNKAPPPAVESPAKAPIAKPPVSQPAASPVASPSSSSSSLPATDPPSSKELFGISYAPYRSDHGCKGQDEVNTDFSQFASQYSVVRVYGTDCNQVNMVYKAAKTHGSKLFLGIWDPLDIENEANKIISGVNGDWDMVHTVSVGNELVNNGQASAQQMVNAVKTTRSILRSAGFKGPVVTVDTFMAAKAHPEICDASDYCAINAHAFFDSTISAGQAGSWLADTVKSVGSGLSTQKKVVVTETGWPTEGSANGLAVPGMANQKLALDAIRSSFASTPQDVILFSAFNDLW
ncbi:hypothetical protein Golomagni_07950, partial [Golovinomyces magnicellulatus]